MECLKSKGSVIFAYDLFRTTLGTLGHIEFNLYLLFAYCLLLSTFCLLPTAFCILLTLYYLLLTTYCILPTACGHPTFSPFSLFLRKVLLRRLSSTGKAIATGGKAIATTAFRVATNGKDISMTVFSTAISEKAIATSILANAKAV